MKNIFLPIIAALCLTACSEDLSEYYNRLHERDAANSELTKENAQREAELAEQEAANAAQAERNAERDQWNEAQAQRNAEQAQENSAMQHMVDSLNQVRDDQLSQNGDLAGMNNDQAQRNEEQRERNAQLRLMWDELQKRLAELEGRMQVPVDPKLLSIEFRTADNAGLRQDVTCKIVGDSVIECWLPGIVTDKRLVPRFTFQGTMVVIDGYESESGKTRIDFKRPRTVAVTTSEKNKYYTIYVHAYTGLPIVYLNTNSGQPVTSKEQYVDGHFKLVEDVRTRAAGDEVEEWVNIKGRGNSSWKFPKKPYRLKFNDKVALLDMHKDRSWVLIPNYNDKSMVRNSAGFYMSSISTLDYTPESHFVELIFNGSYHGTYLLCEKLKISNHRVAVGDDGFLMEIDSRAPGEEDSHYFSVRHMENVVNIKDPDVVDGDDNYEYARVFVEKADAALFDGNFRDLNTGWQHYMDMDSFVDWYLINEIGKNLDSNFDTSCYMNLQRGGKLKMGPIWDFDVAFGNMSQANQICWNPEGFHIKNVKWYARLFQDPAFVKRVKERFNYFYNHKNDIFDNINADAQYLKYAAEENESQWHTFYIYTWPNWDIWGSYQNEVQSLKTWINKRMEWLKVQFDKM